MPDAQPQSKPLTPAQTEEPVNATGLRFPKLFLLAIVLFIIDLVIPDIVPFVDEVILGAVTVGLGLLRKRIRGEPES